MIQIKKAVRERVWLKVAVTGPTGSGKTWGAIGLAKGLAPTGKVLVIDTENRSASYYAGISNQPGAWDFDVVELDAPFTTTKYLEGLQAAISSGYEALVIDSLTHEWAASGGILDQKSQKDARGGNSFTNWNDMKQLHNKFVEQLLQSKIHVVCTLRSKMEYVLEANDKGKMEPRKVGLAPISSDGMEYEFGVVFDVDRNTHLAVASKDRTGLFDGRSMHLGSDIGKELSSWRDSGAELKPEPLPSAPATAPHQASASPAAKESTRAATQGTQSAAQPAVQGAPQPAAPTHQEPPAPDPVFVALLAELAAVTVNMPDQTRTKLLDLWEKEGPTDLDGLRKEIATLKAALKEETVHESFTAAQGDALARKEPVSQAASAFVDGLGVDTDEANGGISPEQYEALGKLLVAFGVDRDCFRSHCDKAGHLLPGKNGPTLARLKAAEFEKFRTRLTNKTKAGKHPVTEEPETWSERTVRIINAVPKTTYAPIAQAS